MHSVDEIWRQVIEAPGDVGLRLVLADALIEEGDPRGELIALQCRGADARVVVDREVDAENAAERVNELVAAGWETWLGELAQVAVRQGSTYEDGMLATVQVGDTDAAVAVWERAAKHRELCAVRRVRPLKARGEHYATFLAALVHDPWWVELPAPQLVRAVRQRRKHWAVREIRYGGIAFWRDDRERGLMTAEMQMLSEMATELERIEIQASALGDELFAACASIQRLFPKLRALQLLDRYGSLRRHADAEQLARVEALPLVEIVGGE